MANADQLINLIKCHVEGDDERFRTLALQISVSEAKSGHTVLAQSIKDLLKRDRTVAFNQRLKMVNSEVSDYLLEVEHPFRITDIIVEDSLRDKINRIIKEYIQKEKLAQYELLNRNKILMTGPSGTGKTMTASVIANALNLPLYVVRIEKIVTKFMGETGLKLSKVFDWISSFRGVYLFDEFDAIGQKRGIDNEVGEMRRVLNTFLKLMERDCSDSIILAATNDIKSIDSALFRRFDDVLEYNLPNDTEKLEIIKCKLADFPPSGDLTTLLPNLVGMSHAEVCSVCADAIKEVLINGREMDMSLLRGVISEKKSEYLTANA